MDFSFDYTIKKPAPVMPKAERRDLQNQRRTNPEIQWMNLTEVQGSKFKLRTPWGSDVEKVPCVDHRLQPYLRAGLTVGVRYDRVDPNNIYIRSLGPVTL